MENKPEIDTETKQKTGSRKPLLFGMVFGGFIIAMIVAMLFIDLYAEQQEKAQGHVMQPSDAAEH